MFTAVRGPPQHYAHTHTHLCSPVALLVNVKLEKTGGFRAAVRAIEAARAAGLKVWVGMMVGSLLLSSMPAHLMPLTDVGGDLDGAMWVLPESNLFDAGYTPRGDGMVHLASLMEPCAYGNGVVLKHPL